MKTLELTEKLIDKMQAWASDLIAMVPNMIIAVLVVFIGWFAAKWVAQALRSALARVSQNTQVNALAARTVRIGVTLGAIFIALGVLHLDKTVTSLLAGVGVVGVALGFAFQDIASNFMSGIMMAFRRPISIGDLIETNGYTGRVTDIDLRATTLETLTGENILLPNKDVFGKPITNFTRTHGRRIDLMCGVAYGTDLRRAREVVIDVLDDLPHRDTNRQVEVNFRGFGDSSVDFRAQIWLSSSVQGHFNSSMSEAVIRIHEAFEKADIEIPFPIRTLKTDGAFRPVIVQDHDHDEQGEGEATAAK